MNELKTIAEKFDNSIKEAIENFIILLKSETKLAETVKKQEFRIEDLEKIVNNRAKCIDCNEFIQDVCCLLGCKVDKNFYCKSFNIGGDNAKT